AQIQLRDVHGECLRGAVPGQIGVPDAVVAARWAWVIAAIHRIDAVRGSLYVAVVDAESLELSGQNVAHPGVLLLRRLRIIRLRLDPDRYLKQIRSDILRRCGGDPYRILLRRARDIDIGCTAGHVDIRREIRFREQKRPSHKTYS